jgi:hypothetical protein
VSCGGDCVRSSPRPNHGPYLPRIFHCFSPSCFCDSISNCIGVRLGGNRYLVGRSISGACCALCAGLVGFVLVSRGFPAEPEWITPGFSSCSYRAFVADRCATLRPTPADFSVELCSVFCSIESGFILTILTSTPVKRASILRYATSELLEPGRLLSWLPERAATPSKRQRSNFDQSRSYLR